MQYRYEMESPIGRLLLLSNGTALTGVYFEGHKPAPKDDSGMVDAKPFTQVISQLQEYFVGDRDAFDVEISFAGTDFQQQVWSQLQTIPCGETMSYSQIADRCDRPKAVRAVGAAVGRNPISIIIPCHRVLGANGAITGFAGGVERKQWLLERERALSST